MAIDPSTKYVGQVAADAAFPYGKARNESSSGARDGTPLEADLVNDIWGFQQALLDDVGVTPTGTPDEVGASQYLDAIKEIIARNNKLLSLNNFVDVTISGETENFSGVAFDGDRTFVAVGTNAIIYTSHDGKFWDSRTPAGGYTGSFRAVTWSPSLSLFLAVGQTAEIQTSPDGITWTQRAADGGGGFAGQFYASIWNGSLFVIAGTSGEIQTSADGITWTQRTAAGSYVGTFYGAAWGLSLFVLVGSGGEIQTSPDGITWTQRTADGSYSDDFRAAAFDSVNSAFVIAGDLAEIQRSTNGTSWSQVSADNTSDDFFGATANADYILVVGEDHEIQSSSDGGLTWTHRGPGSSGSAFRRFEDVVHDGEAWIIVGIGAAIHTSIRVE